MGSGLVSSTIRPLAPGVLPQPADGAHRTARISDLRRAMLDTLHARAVRSRLLQRFTAFTRVLLAVGFLPPGLIKVLGHRFTTLPVSDPVGYFFDAFFQAEAFYAFVGLAQVAAALLLLVPRTATLGAVLYFPIILTITVVTWSIGFAGTRWITVLMTLACLWLLFWDYDRLKGLLPTKLAAGSGYRPREYALQAGLWATAGAGAGILAVALHLANLHRQPWLIPLGLAVAGAVFGLVVAWHLRQLPASPGNRT